jgi:hypothetical protein
MDAQAVIAGSSTHNNGMLPLVADMLTYMKGLKPQNKIGAAFGSYGWSGEAPKQLSEFLQAAKVEIVAEPLRIKNVPTDQRSPVLPGVWTRYRAGSDQTGFGLIFDEILLFFIFSGAPCERLFFAAVMQNQHITDII